MRRLDDRKVLCGILFVLHTGIQWEFLPQELGFGSGMTCWRRLEEWNSAGVWQRPAPDSAGRTAQRGHAGPVPGGDRLLARAGRAARPKSGPEPGRPRPAGLQASRPDRRPRHPPGRASLTGGNRNDVTQLRPLVDAFPPLRGSTRTPTPRPDELYADRGYDHDKYRKALRDRGIRPLIARRGTAHGSGLGAYRWVVERTIAWYHGMKRLRIRWERRDDIHEAFLDLATCIIAYRHVVRLC